METMVDIINLHNVLPQGVKPSTRPLCGTQSNEGLFEVAAHRDCPFHLNLISFVSVALIVGSPRAVISRYAVPCSPDFPRSLQK